MSPYEDIMPIFPLLLPVGLAISAALLLAGVAGVYSARQRIAA